MILQFVLMLALSLIITKQVSSSAREDATQKLVALAETRAVAVEEFVENAENKLQLFAISPVVKEVLKNKTDSAIIAKAQAFNTEFAAQMQGVEGLYIAGWDTYVFTHSVVNGGSIGKTFRDGESLASLQDAISTQGTNVYVTGIVKSPTTEKMVLSMYRGIKDDDGSMIGFVGLALQTDILVEKLSAIKTPGLDHSTYTMIDVNKTVYVFDQENADNPGKALELPDLIRTCDEYRTGKNTDRTTSYEYALPGMGSFIGASVWLENRGWVLMMNDQKSEVYRLVYAMRTFLGIFSGLILVLMLIFTYLNKKQEKVNMKLVSSMEKFNQAKQSLNSAMFNDVLTDVGNRIKLATELSDVQDGKTNPYFFAMFNVMDFSSINTAFGSDTGDAILVRTADMLKKAFPKGSVYRTGSDEFVVMVRTADGNPRIDTMIADVEDALRMLIVPETIEGVGTLYPKYKVSVIKKNSTIDPSVVTILKEMTNMKGEAIVGMIDFSDLSE